MGSERRDSAGATLLLGAGGWEESLGGARLFCSPSGCFASTRAGIRSASAAPFVSPLCGDGEGEDEEEEELEEEDEEEEDLLGCGAPFVTTGSLALPLS